MASYTTVEDWTDVEQGQVVDVTIRQTTSERYPSGWDYSLHLGEVGGDTLLRYDNAHERTKGHERHTREGVETIEFPDMLALYDRFRRGRGTLARVVGLASVGRPREEPIMSTLKVTVGKRDQLDERTRRRIAAAQGNEDIEDAQPVLNFGSYAELNRLLSPANLELLEEIAAHEPDSIRAVAELVDRDYRQVHRNLHELADIGVIEFEGGDPGRAKKPTLAYDGLEIDIPFADTGERPDAAAP